MSNHSILEFIRIEHAIDTKDADRLERMRSQVEKFVHDGGVVFVYDRSKHAHGELHFPSFRFSTQEEIEEAFVQWKKAIEAN